MEICESNIEKISKTFNSVRDISFYEKKEIIAEQYMIDRFLDRILELKEVLKVKTDRTEEITVSLEEITWFKGLDETCLKMVNEIISLAKDLHSSLHQMYLSLNIFIRKGIAIEEIAHFKDVVDDLKETCEDLESVFFYLPQNELFKVANRDLSMLQ